MSRESFPFLLSGGNHARFAGFLYVEEHFERNYLLNLQRQFRLTFKIAKVFFAAHSENLDNFHKVRAGNNTPPVLAMS